MRGETVTGGRQASANANLGRANGLEEPRAALWLNCLRGRPLGNLTGELAELRAGELGLGRAAVGGDGPVNFVLRARDLRAGGCGCESRHQGGAFDDRHDACCVYVCGWGGRGGVRCCLWTWWWSVMPVRVVVMDIYKPSTESKRKRGGRAGYGAGGESLAKDL